MAYRRLNKSIRSEIRSSIELSVKAKMKESIPGIELNEAHRKITEFIVKELKKRFTEKEMVILRKYKHVKHLSEIKLAKSKDKLTNPWNTGTYFTLKFDEVEVPNTGDFSKSSIIEILQNDDRMRELAFQALKIFEHIKCEVLATTNAYMEIVETYRTEKALIEDYPDIEKHIPKAEDMDSPSISKEAKSIVKNFKL